MKFLKPIIMRHRPSIRWAILVGTVLWMTVASETLARATTTEYKLDPGGYFYGTFTLDTEDLERPFTSWNIGTNGFAFFTGSLDFEQQLVTGFGAQLVTFSVDADSDEFPHLSFKVNTLILTYDAEAYTPNMDGPNLYRYAEEDGKFKSITSVPEPSVAVLLAVGLLALAGSRWLPRRGARQQLG